MHLNIVEQIQIQVWGPRSSTYNDCVPLELFTKPIAPILRDTPHNIHIEYDHSYKPEFNPKAKVAQWGYWRDYHNIDYVETRIFYPKEHPTYTCVPNEPNPYADLGQVSHEMPSSPTVDDWDGPEWDFISIDRNQFIHL